MKNNYVEDNKLNIDYNQRNLIAKKSRSKAYSIFILLLVAFSSLIVIYLIKKKDKNIDEYDNSCNSFDLTDQQNC